MRRIFALVALTVLSAVPLVTLSHGDGAFFETTVGNYIIDIGYSSPAPAVGEAVVFDFQIRDVGTKLISGSDVEFSDVWVRIESEKKTLLATGLYNAEFGGPRLSYVFPEKGEYNVYARYENGSKSLAEISFPLVVVEESKRGNGIDLPPFVAFGAFGIVIGFAGAILFRRFHRF